MNKVTSQLIKISGIYDAWGQAYKSDAILRSSMVILASQDSNNDFLVSQCCKCHKLRLPDGSFQKFPVGMISTMEDIRELRAYIMHHLGTVALKPPRPGIEFTPQSDIGVSHTYCPECMQEELSALKAFKEQQNNPE